MLSCGEKQESILVDSERMDIQANILFFYYENLDAVQQFYEDIIGLEIILDYGFAKVYSCSPTAFIGLVDEALGLHNFSEEKSVTFSFISEQIEDWYKHMIKKDLEIREPLSQSETIPVKAFVTYDVAGYFLEFDWFPEHEKNTKLLSFLK